MGIRIQTQIVRVEGKDADHCKPRNLRDKFMVQNLSVVEILLSVRPAFLQKMNIFVVCMWILSYHLMPRRDSNPRQWVAPDWGLLKDARFTDELQNRCWYNFIKPTFFIWPFRAFHQKDLLLAKRWNFLRLMKEYSQNWLRANPCYQLRRF